MSQCFISHATEDRHFVEEELIGLLKAIGIETWYAEEDIGTAQQWERSIRNGLESCDWFVLVMSPHSAQSEWVKNELHWIFENKPDRLIPILIEECEPADFHVGLPRIQHADFAVDPQAARNKLITIFIDGEFRPPRRASGIIGQWTGKIQQDEGPDGGPLEYTADLSLEIVRQKIKGRFVVLTEMRNGRTQMAFVLTGGFFHERFLQMNYIAENPAIIQFGSIVMELNDNADTMVGKFVGHGALSKRIVGGDLQLRKIVQLPAGAADAPRRDRKKKLAAPRRKASGAGRGRPGRLPGR